MYKLSHHILYTKQVYLSTIYQLYINKFSLCIVGTKTNYVFVWLAYGERWLHGEREPDRDQKNEDPDEKELPVASLLSDGSE